MASKPRVSVIIPTLNEELSILPLLQDLRSLNTAFGIEIIVVDGGSTDQTCLIASRYADLVLNSFPGRGKQLNLGAKYATGEVLWFLHADSKISEDCLAQISQTIASGYHGGCFKLAFDSEQRTLRAIAWGSNLRAKLLKSFYGDQGIFVSRSLFMELEGFLPLPIMEDLEFSQRLRKAASLTVLSSRIVTSSRRFRAGGALPTLLLMQLLKLGYHLKISPDTLARIYSGKRRLFRLWTWSPND